MICLNYPKLTDAEILKFEKCKMQNKKISVDRKNKKCSCCLTWQDILTFKKWWDLKFHGSRINFNKKFKFEISAPEKHIKGDC